MLELEEIGSSGVMSMDEQEAIEQMLYIIEGYQSKYEFILSNPDYDMFELLDYYQLISTGKYEH